MEQNPNGQLSIVQHHRSTPLSALPGDIFHKIISLLNFPQSSIFTISDSTFNVEIVEPVTYKCSVFWKILDNIFTIFTTPSINTFLIHLHHTLYDALCVKPNLDSWARRLCARNFQHISIKSYTISNLYYNGYINFPPGVFQIHSLVSLELHDFNIREFDQLVSLPIIILPNLKKLVLGCVYYDILEWLVSCCPSIEDLSFVIRTTHDNHPLSISSKNLKRLSITIWSMGMWMFDYIPNIEIIINVPTLEHLHYDATFLSMRMFDLIPNVKSVQVFGNSTMELYDNPTKKIIFPSFLTHLTLTLSSEIFKATFEQQMLHCPNLEVLEIRFFECYIYDFNWDPKDMFMLVEHVKRLELRMLAVQFNQETLNLVTWLLRSAPVLEKLILDAARGPYYSYGDIMSKAQFRKTLFECAEDSSGCQIELIGKWHKLD